MSLDKVSFPLFGAIMGVVWEKRDVPGFPIKQNCTANEKHNDFKVAGKNVVIKDEERKKKE